MLKRLFDLLLVLIGAVVWVPALAVVAVLVRTRLGTPVFFRQERPGLHGRPFMMVKFRSMTDARDASGALLPDADRLPHFGRRLRATSLDELPELLNVLSGEMSLVGPRPLLMRYLDRYTPRQRRRHEMKPGITGLAQVSGRNALGWPERLELDVQYVERQSLLLDIRILWRTVMAVVRRDGISAAGEATMAEFTGAPDAPVTPESPLLR
ncbi:MAG: sugar transferase [Gemmatimonadaceae bacterium]|nr:sugar transferase [Gemmatimonadaceae bacterium]